MNSALRIHLATALVLLATFSLGILTGVGASRLWGHRSHHGFGHEHPRLPPPFAELGLTGDQEHAARAIVERHRPELEAILSEGFPKVQAIHTQIRREMSAVLTPEQEQRLQELEAQRPPGARFFGGRPMHHPRPGGHEPPTGFGPPPSFGPPGLQPPPGEPPPPPGEARPGDTAP